MSGRLIFLAFWSVFFTANVTALYRDDRTAFVPEGEPIAKLVERSGTVQYRPDGLILWNDVLREQLFFEGDNLATGADGHARVQFDSGRMVEIGSNSQIKLSAPKLSRDDLISTLLKEDESKEFVVTLVKGDVRAKTQDNVAKETKFVVKTGEKTFDIRKQGAEIALSKAAGEVEVEVTAAKDAAVVEDGKETKVEEKIEAPKPKWTAKDLEPQISFPEDGATFWTTLSLSSAAQEKQFVVTIAPPLGDYPEEWVPFLKINLVGRSGDGMRVNGVYGREPQKIKLPLSLLAQTTPVKRRIPEGQLRVTPGAELNGVATGEPRTYVFRSLRDVQADAILVRLGAVNFREGTGDTWFEQKGEIAAANAKLSIILASAQDLPRLAPLIAGSNTFTVLPGQISFAEESVYAVREGMIVARLTGTWGGRENLAKIRQLLGAEVIVKGTPEALAAGEKEIRYFKGLNKNRVYVLNENEEKIGVNRDLLKSGAVEKFLEENTKTRKVKNYEVLDSAE